jgi:hypothetical protein
LHYSERSGVGRERVTFVMASKALARQEEEIRFAPDSPLEEAVTSEPVSVLKNSLLAANLQGISLDSGSLWHFRRLKRMRIQSLTEPIR